MIENPTITAVTSKNSIQLTSGVAKFLTSKIIVLPKYPAVSAIDIKNPALLLYLK